MLYILTAVTPFILQMMTAALQPEEATPTTVASMYNLLYAMLHLVHGKYQHAAVPY